MPRLRVTFLLLLALLVAPLGGAQAAPIFFGFSLEFASGGPVGGQSIAGTFSVDGDDCAGACSGTFLPNSAGPTLLSFDVSVGGTSFAMNGDAAFPSSPRVDLANDVVTLVVYASPITTPRLTIQFSKDPNININTVNFTIPEGGVSEGIFVPGQRLQVPEPGTLALLGLAVAGLAATRRRRKQ